MKLTFSLEKETPGALRYLEIDSDGTPLKNDVSGAHIGTLYIRKWIMNGSLKFNGGKVPDKLVVDVQPAK